MYRERLPQLDGGLFVTDGGIETTLIFHHGLELRAFAAFDLLKDEQGTEELQRYFAPYAELAREQGVGLVLGSQTWRANPDWANEIDHSLEEQDAFNRKAIVLMEELRKSHAERDEATELGESDPDDLGERHAALKERLPNVNVLGGCCGTDHRHVESRCTAWLANHPAASS